MKTLLKLFLLFIALLISVTFTVLNPGSVDVDLYTTKLHLPLSALVVIALFIGLVLGGLSNLVTIFGSRRTARQLKKQLANAETELAELRKAPLRDDA
ncbi:MAG: LapA family protein [bacterium]